MARIEDIPHPGSVIRHPLLWAVLGALIVCFPAFPAGLHADDFTLLNGLRINAMDVLLEGRVADAAQRFWRPLPWAEIALEQWTGLGPNGFRIVGILVHLACVVGVWKLARRWLGGEQAAIATMLFAVHVRHAEPVLWLSARPDLWAALFSLWTLWMWTRGGRASLFWVTLGTSAALLSKESALALPLLLAVTCRRPAGRPWIHLAAPMAAALAYVSARAWVLGDWLGGYGSTVHGALSISSILGPLLSFPTVLAMPFPPGYWAVSLMDALRASPRIALVAGAVMVIGGGLVAWRARRVALASTRLERSEGGATLLEQGILVLGLFLVGLIPYFNLPVTLEGGSDRYLYLPSVWFCMGLSLIIPFARGPFGPTPSEHSRVQGLEADLSREGVKAREDARLPGLGRRLARPAFVVLIAGLALSHLVVSARWANAGALATETLERVEQAVRARKGEPVSVAGIPGRRDGIPVLYTGLSGGLAMRSREFGGASPRIGTVIRVDDWPPVSPVKWTVQKAGSDPERLDGICESGRQRFRVGSSPQQGGGDVEVRAQGRQVSVSLTRGAAWWVLEPDRGWWVE